MSSDFSQFLAQFLASIGSFVWGFLAISWWLWAFIILASMAHSMWFFWRKSIYKNEETQFIVMEIRIPREIKKNPRAMEQVLTSIYMFRNTPNTLAEKWWDGEVTRWITFEVVSFGGETHFYARVYWRQKALLQSAFLSYYPDLEIVEVDDYVDKLPANMGELYKRGYDMWGTDIILKNKAAYPIKTYEDFEAQAEEKEYDTMASFLELFSALKREEIVAVQILIAPADPDWRKKWEGLLSKLKSNKEDAPKPGTTTSFPTDYSFGPLPMFEVKVPGKDEMGFLKTAFRTPGETDVLKAVGRNLSKPAFDTMMRMIYLSPKSIFHDSFPRRGIRGVFNQFSALDLNSLVFNEKMSVSQPRVTFFWFPFIFPVVRSEYKKARVLYNYIHREILEEEFMGKVMTSAFFNWNFKAENFEMNTECLATVFPPPGYLALTGPHVKRVESRKGGPPAGLAIFGGEENVEKLQ